MRFFFLIWLNVVLWPSTYRTSLQNLPISTQWLLISVVKVNVTGEQVHGDVSSPERIPVRAHGPGRNKKTVTNSFPKKKTRLFPGVWFVCDNFSRWPAVSNSIDLLHDVNSAHTSLRKLNTDRFGNVLGFLIPHTFSSHVPPERCKLVKINPPTCWWRCFTSEWSHKTEIKSIDFGNITKCV